MPATAPLSVLGDGCGRCRRQQVSRPRWYGTAAQPRGRVESKFALLLAPFVDLEHWLCASCQCRIRLPATFAVLGVAILVTDHQYAKSGIFRSIDDGVGKVSQRVDPSAVCGRSSKTGMLLQQFCDALEFGEESSGEAGSRFAFVEPNCLCEIFLCEAVDELLHRTSACNLARTASSVTRAEGF